ncbi:MAG: hypothetical protein BTN85_1621 [Candidatus Methanohalarchaeum thermophilum]|uniref:Uncharacterized protein n=1 Tax=Methanohalarchaeum thermophilum TaxID=1903181 RepID=A0A1Q6DXM2_METT1|nr:MAG: hypothetical protein BTN85_1621 [Candidatus Methanohalarchaeum thermophilum]
MQNNRHNKGKLKAIKEEYKKTQGYIRGETTDLYSATKQAMDKYIDIEKLKDGK